MSKESSAQRQWFYIDQAGNTQGPMSLGEVQQQNIGVADFYLFTEGLTDWVQASDLPRVLASLNDSSPGPRPKEAPSNLATEKQRRWLMALGAAVPDGLTKREASSMIEDLKERGVFPEPDKLAEYHAWKKQSEPHDPSAPHNQPATEDQRIELSLYGIQAPPELSKSDAMDLLAKKRKEVLVPETEDSRTYSRLKDEQETKQHERALEAKKSVFASFVDKLKPRKLSPDELTEIRDVFKNWMKDFIDELNERINDEKEIRAEKRMRVQSMLALFGREGIWGNYYIKPTKEIVEEVLAEMDALYPGGSRSGWRVSSWADRRAAGR